MRAYVRVGGPSLGGEVPVCVDLIMEGTWLLRCRAQDIIRAPLVCTYLPD